MQRLTPSPSTPGRIRFLAGLFFFLFLCIVVRLGQLQITSGSYYRDMAEDQHSFFARLIPARGEIKISDQLSPDAVPVATNIEASLLYAVPKEITNPALTARLLAPLLGMADVDDLERKLSNKSKVYVPLKHRLLDSEKQAIADLNLAGIRFDTETVRFYPERQFLSHVVGFLGYREDSGSNQVGVYGLERAFDKALSGKAGSTRGLLAGAWPFGTRSDFVPAQNGTQLFLTIDRSVQLQVEQVLHRAVVDNQADGGCIIVMNPHTGSIVAMASNPTYDPNEYNKVTDHSVFVNSCTSGNYEPGSVFKAVTMAAGLDVNAVAPDSTFTDPGQVVVDGYTIKNSDNKAHGVQTMTQVLEESLNTGVIYVKDKVGNKTFADYVNRFGFGAATGVDLPESTGNVNNLKGNVKVNFHTASFGQGISVTPLQLVRAYGAIANGGRLPTPHVIAARIDADGATEPVETQLSGQIISNKTATTLAAMLVSVVERGHGKRAQVPGYYVAGKTGTAQVAKKDGGGYDPNNNIGTFIGFAPVEDPQFVMLVRVDHPRTVQYAENTAAPAWGKLAQFLLSYYNVPPNRALK